jgi:hypothetical protein
MRSLRCAWKSGQKRANVPARERVRDIVAARDVLGAQESRIVRQHITKRAGSCGAATRVDGPGQMASGRRVVIRFDQASSELVMTSPKAEIYSLVVEGSKCNPIR